MSTVVLLAVMVALGALASAWAHGRHIARTPQQAVQQVASGLRCPVCQDLSVADSTSSVAQAMRAEIGRRLADGQTPQQVDAYFVSRYGQWILLSPRWAGLNVVVWITPLVAALAGAVIVGKLVLRPVDPEPRPASDRDRLRIEAELASFEERD